ncbi:MAG: type II toxin-antitoxin system toxin DNA ADP-ribosyl transferase DarT [Nitrososphaerales archaeon]
MSPVPESPKIYHITHVDNLSRIVDEVLWSDAERVRRALECTVVGMSEIKRRRLEEIEVDCHPGTKVGQYVPFYFCHRSVMLYILHKDNHPDLAYHGGQRPIVHLQADLRMVLKWAETEPRRWTFSKCNAGARYADFHNDPALLGGLDWGAIAQTDWRDPDVKEAKQAEFLVEKSFPWRLIELIGVINSEVERQVTNIISGARHQPSVAVKTAWYY